MVEEYERKLQVATYEVGADSRLKLSVLLRICQETSEQHLEQVNLGYERLKNEGLVFLIISNAASIRRLPRLGESITVKTHPRGTLGVHFYRDFDFYAGGERIVHVMQSSVSVDPASHKPLRPKVFLSYQVFRDEKLPREERVEKIAAPAMPELGRRIIRYSDIDYNNHLNNAVYGDITEDFLPGGMQGRSPSYVQIDYVSEAFLGEELKICGQEQDGQAVLQGFHERGLCFSALLR